jgi:hypothetical protein
MIDAAECRRQAAIREQEALSELDIDIRNGLVNMSQGWTTLAKQIEWLARIRSTC